MIENIILITIILLIIIAVFVFIIPFICFYMAFYVRNKDKKLKEEFDMPPGKIYEPYHAQMKIWMQKMRAMKSEDVYITSFDGLKLHAKYYEGKKGAPVEIMFHGYRGSAERDLCGGIQRSFDVGRNVLLVDQRASMQSGGNVISFGINESKDCLKWIEYVNKKFDGNIQIYLAGVSMGASTVLMATGYDLPKNVVGVVADCGYSNIQDIISVVVKKMGIPPFLALPFIKLGARIYGKFNIDELNPIDAVKKSKIPTIFFHGDEDDFVPMEMSQINYDACASKKRLVIIKGAGHGLCYCKEPKTYIDELKSFEQETLEN
ncbi:MAG: alpha/beta hydrolase [Clostridia bacterium]|nr:alpha/beta hydrolase [Clostridia bacterium]